MGIGKILKALVAKNNDALRAETTKALDEKEARKRFAFYLKNVLRDFPGAVTETFQDRVEELYKEGLSEIEAIRRLRHVE